MKAVSSSTLHTLMGSSERIPIAAASEYIQLHHGDKDKLAESLGIVAQTATSIITAIMRERDADAAYPRASNEENQDGVAAEELQAA